MLKVHITPENIGFWDELVHLDLMGSAKEVSVSEGDLIEFVGNQRHPLWFLDLGHCDACALTCMLL